MPIPYDSPTVSLDRSEGRVICCPECGGLTLHQCTVTVYERDGEDGPGTKVEVLSSKAVNVTRLERADLPGRRQSLDIEFRCEICNFDAGASFILRIAQHKGETQVAWLR